MENDPELVEIYSGELWQATIVKELLDDSWIAAFVENELMGNVAPWQVSDGGLAAVSVAISSADYALAKPIVDKFTDGSYPLSDDADVS